MGLFRGVFRSLFLLTIIPAVGCGGLQSSLTEMSSDLDATGKKDIEIYGFQLVDGESGAVLFGLEEGVEIDLIGITQNLRIRADVSSATQSVEFILNSEVALDNEYPFEITMTRATGSALLSGVAYLKTNRRGVSNGKTVSFKLVDSSSQPPMEEMPMEEEPPMEEMPMDEDPSMDEMPMEEEPSMEEMPTDPNEINFDGPIVINKGGTYQGNWQSLDPNVPAVKITTGEPVVIQNSVIRSRGHLINAGYKAQVTVKNVRGYGLNPNIAGKANGRFLNVDTYRYIRVENSYLEETAGIYLHSSEVGATVKILKNQARNIIGWKSNGNEGWLGESNFHLVQFVQFDKGNSLVDTEIAWNEVINDPFKSRVEDVMNFYKTTGTAQSPIRIHNNFIKGAYPTDPTSNSYSGGGIMMGDEGGKYIHATNNQVVSTTNYGIAIAGGENNVIANNRVVNCGKLSDGRQIAALNVGYYVWHYSKDYAFINNGGENNYAAYTNFSTGGSRNDWWVPDAAYWTGNTKASSGAVPCSAEADEFMRWQQKLTSESVKIGP